MAITFSTVEEADNGVEDGVDEAITQWKEQIEAARGNLTRLQGAVSQIIMCVKIVRSEAKWSFGRGQDGEGWLLTIYSDKPSDWDLEELVDPLVTKETCVRLGLYLISLGFDELET